MKNIILLLTLFLFTQLKSQSNFSLLFGKTASLTTQQLINGQKIPITEIPEEIKIVSSDNSKTYILIKVGESIYEVETEFTGSSPTKVDISKLNFSEEGEATFQIKEKGISSIILTFHLIIATEVKNEGGSGKSTTLIQTPFSIFWNQLNFDISPTQFGLTVKSGNTIYKGKQYVHIFLDQYGNSINGTIPQGISDRQYVVHVIYLTGIENDLTVFDIKKIKGNFNPSLNYLNSDLRDGKTIATSSKEVNYTWVHKEFLLGTSTSDIEFDLTKTTITNGNNPYNYKNDKINSFTINMTPTFHGSFNVGFVNSRLENPTYQLVENPLNSSEKVVKRMNIGNRGMTTIMATIYTSPIVLIKKLFDKKNDIPWNKTYGRNFLDDHKFYERFYPVIGVGLTDNSLENIFYGLNWELTRGAGIFIGWHWGKINTYKTSSGFEFEKSPTTQAEFDLNSNQKWKTSSLSIGVNVDPFLILRLFKGGLVK
jgi:hypothetical protein